MVNLDDHIERTKIVSQIYNDVDFYCREAFKEDARNHLGASIIGDNCQAKSWNTFRWLNQEALSGQQLRLFNRGHLEEARFIKWLQGIGFEVWEADPETGAQFRIQGCKGHFGGSLDSVIRAPERYGLGNLVWLGEFKTHNEKSYTKLAGKKPSFKSLGKPQSRMGGEGVRISKPTHYRQMCSYGRAYSINYGLYCAVNKDTDELYFEIVPLDYREADDLFRKAEGIVFSQVQPPKIAQTETFFDCSFCHFSGICHRKELPTKNCRSCINAVPIENGEWWCNLFSPQLNAPIAKDFIAVGCDAWKAIINA